MLIAGLTSAIWAGAVVIFEPHIETFIMDVINKNKGASTRGDLAKHSGLEKSQVAREFGKMYKDFKETQENIDLFNKTWIPHLENEKTFFYVGFFVKTVNNEPEMWYKDFDAKEYPAWHDEGGWFYQKQGYKYYQ
jgi:hypothetical protein